MRISNIDDSERRERPSTSLTEETARTSRVTTHKPCGKVQYLRRQVARPPALSESATSTCKKRGAHPLTHSFFFNRANASAASPAGLAVPVPKNVDASTTLRRSPRHVLTLGIQLPLAAQAALSVSARAPALGSSVLASAAPLERSEKKASTLQTLPFEALSTLASAPAIEAY